MVLRLHVGAETPAAANDATPEIRSLRVVGCKRIVDVSVRGEEIGERFGVASGFGRAHSNMRSRDKGGVAEQDDAADSHADGFEIDDRLQQGLQRFSHDFSERRREQSVGVGAHLGEEVGA